MSSHKHSVVIVGGGVGGLRAATRLSHDSYYDVTLISSSRSFVHRASLYRNKRGRSRRHLSIPLQQALGKQSGQLDLVRAHISEFNPMKRVVTSTEGVEYDYDSLIVSLKVEGRPLEQFEEDSSFSAYNAGHMHAMRRLLIRQFEDDVVQENYVVIGAGEAGVEMVAELKLLLDHLSAKYRIDEHSYRVILFESSDHILPHSSNVIRDKVGSRLHKLGIVVSLNSHAKSLYLGKLTFADGRTMNAGKVVVAAGTKANDFFTNNNDEFLLDADGFARVNSLLEAEGFNDVYVIGASKATATPMSTDAMLYDADYLLELLRRKKDGKQIHNFSSPEFETEIDVGRRWSAVGGNRDRVAYIGWATKRWRDLKHFSTLLPKRVSYPVWLFGSKHDEIY